MFSKLQKNDNDVLMQQIIDMVPADEQINTDAS